MSAPHQVPIFKFDNEKRQDPDEEFIQKFVATQQQREEHAGKRTPIVIDNGSYRLRAGYSSYDEPSINFPQLVGRPKARRDGDFVLVGDQIKRVGNKKLQVKTQFEHDVVVQYELMEYVLDYTFGTLGIEDDSVDHPIVITETKCNPTISRRHMSELLFECYTVPSICYGIDDLFSLYYNQQCGNLPRPLLDPVAAMSQSFCWDSLIVSSGFWNSYVIPYYGGKPRLDQCNRISVGGYQAVDNLLRQLGLRYPQHRHALSIERAQDILYKYSYCALDYAEELEKIEHNDHCNAVIAQLPYKKIEQPKKKSDEEIAQLKEKRRQNGLRLQRMAQKRRQEKLKEQTSLLEAYDRLRDMRQSGVYTYHQYINKILEGGFESEAEFEQTYMSLRNKVEQQYTSPDDSSIDEEKREEQLYPLLKIPDDQLNPDQLKEKSHQAMRKAAAETRARKKLEKERQKLLQEQESLLLEEKFNEDPQAFRDDLHQQRQQLIQKREQRMKTRADSRRRKSSAQRKKMKILAEMGTGKLDDKFGSEDSHWDVYRQIGADDDEEDEEKERTELDEVEALIAKYDPDSVMSSAEHRYPKDEDYQLVLTVDRIRAPEIIFQPAIIGVDQGGLADTIYRVLERLDPRMKQKIVKNVFVTGGNTGFQCLKERLTAEIVKLMPFKSEVSVTVAQDPILDAWKGARLFANTNSLIPCSVTREEYLENGGDYFKEHAFSNFSMPQSELPLDPNTPAVVSQASISKKRSHEDAMMQQANVHTHKRHPIRSVPVHSYNNVGGNEMMYEDEEPQDDEDY